MQLPVAILFDMDDTLISSHGRPDDAWRRAVATYPDRPAWLQPAQGGAEIFAAARWFWSDPVRHREGRLAIDRTRREIVARGLAAIRSDGADDEALVVGLAEHFSDMRDRETALFPDAVETLETLASRGVRLGLITNGAAQEQRRKVERFDLARHFVHVQIEGEMGFGKPEEQAYAHALGALGTTAAETWIVGDNLDWEVVVPQRLGFHAIWRDPSGRGELKRSDVRPDRIIRRLAELVEGP